MSHSLENKSTMNTNANMSKVEINAWRKRRSFVEPDNPLMLGRRVSQGEMIRSFYGSILN